MRTLVSSLVVSIATLLVSSGAHAAHENHNHPRNAKLTKVAFHDDAAPAPAVHEKSGEPSKDDKSEKAEKKHAQHDAKNEDLRGLYIRGVTAGKPGFSKMLDSMKARDINAVVLDAKDYDGWLTYPSKVALANESGAVKDPPIADLREKIREIHDKGIKVIMRVSCFNDEHLSHARPAQAVQSKAHRAYPIGWVDPSNPLNQKYVMDLAKEAMDAGADEIQLDYVRYPVTGIHNADFHLAERGLTQIKVITKFVHDVHAITKARGIPLSLDIFGVIAFGKRVDIEGLGQDPALLAAEAETLSPMVYPSHYDAGFAGFDVPGDHPELVGMALKLMKQQIAHVPHAAKLRPWLQAARYESPTFSATWVAQEVQSGNRAGGDGWLMWNPGQGYGTVWAAVARK